MTHGRCLASSFSLACEFGTYALDKKMLGHLVIFGNIFNNPKRKGIFYTYHLVLLDVKSITICCINLCMPTGYFSLLLRHKISTFGFNPFTAVSVQIKHKNYTHAQKTLFSNNVNTTIRNTHGELSFGWTHL